MNRFLKDKDISKPFTIVIKFHSIWCFSMNQNLVKGKKWRYINIWRSVFSEMDTILEDITTGLSHMKILKNCLKKLSVDPVNTHLCTFKNDIFKIFYLDQRKKTVIYFCLTILFLSTLILECIWVMINKWYISWQPDIAQKIHAPFWKAHNVTYMSYFMSN